MCVFSVWIRGIRIQFIFLYFLSGMQYIWTMFISLSSKGWDRGYLRVGALALLLLSGLSCCSAEACVEPQITPSYYTTSDAVISTETVFIVEISLTCKNRVQNMALYADVSGKQFPVTRGQDVGRYQVSWSLDHKSAHAGTYEVRFFDEESYSLLRKAQRNNEDVSVIPPLFTVSVDHRGTWNGPWVSTEVLAAAIGLVIYYLAFSAKSHIQA